jgi:hypothetical protein
MFSFFNMCNNYKDRKVARFENEDLMIDTCSVTDGKQQYETAVQHYQYNNNDMVIVQAYDTKEEALKGHNEWVQLMTSDKLPEYLRDCGNSEISQFIEEAFDDSAMIFPRKE